MFLLRCSSIFCSFSSHPASGVSQSVRGSAKSHSSEVALCSASRTPLVLSVSYLLSVCLMFGTEYAPPHPGYNYSR